MQSESTDGLTSAPEELGDNHGTKSEFEELAEDSGDVTAPAESLDDDDSFDNHDGRGTVGEWQDWRCQQASKKMSGVPPLCNACKHFFGEYQPFAARYAREREGYGGISKSSLWLRFLATLQALQLSSRNGCEFCKLIFASIKGDSPGFEPAETVNIRFQVTVLQEQSPDLRFTYMGGISPRNTVVRSDVKYLCLLPGIRIRLSNLFYLYKLIAPRQTI